MILSWLICHRIREDDWERHASLLHGQSDWMLERAIQQPTRGSGAPVLIVLDGAVKVFHLRGEGLNVLVNVAGPGTY